jgi:hypothetical protein
VPAAVAIVSPRWWNYWWKQSYDLLPPGIVRVMAASKPTRPTSTLFAGRPSNSWPPRATYACGPSRGEWTPRTPKAHRPGAVAAGATGDRRSARMQEQQQSRLRWPSNWTAPATFPAAATQGCSINDGSSSTAPPPPCMHGASCRPSTPSCGPASDRCHRQYRGNVGGPARWSHTVPRGQYR